MMSRLSYLLVSLLLIASCGQKPNIKEVAQTSETLVEPKTETDTLQGFVEKLFGEIVPKHRSKELNPIYLTNEFCKLSRIGYEESEEMADVWICKSEYRSKLKYEVGKVKQVSADTAFVEIVCHNDMNTYPVHTRMIVENGCWKIDDFDTVKEEIMTSEGLPIPLLGNLKDYSVRFVDQDEEARIIISKSGKEVESCKVPTGMTVKNFMLGMLIPTSKGFKINAMWGGGNNMHDTTYTIEYKNSRFYLVYVEDAVGGPSDPDEEDNTEVRKKSFAKPVPFNGMNFEFYLDVD